jgi:hypothetical protein
MRRSQRLIAATVLIALSSALAGCSSLYNWDPSDMLDWLDTKKKLPGDRKPVFPEGVPGLEQGVPKDLYKGATEQQQQQQNAQPRARASRRPGPSLPRQRSPKPRLRMTAPPRRRRRPSRRKSSASAPPRRHPTSRRRSPPSRPSPRSRSNRRRRSRPRCRPVLSRASLVFHDIVVRADPVICA